MRRHEKECAPFTERVVAEGSTRLEMELDGREKNITDSGERNRRREAQGGP